MSNETPPSDSGPDFDFTASTASSPLLYHLSSVALFAVVAAITAVLAHLYLQNIEAVTGNVPSFMGLSGWQLAGAIGTGVVALPTIGASLFRAPLYGPLAIAAYLCGVLISFMPSAVAVVVSSLFVSMTAPEALFIVLGFSYTAPMLAAAITAVLVVTGKMDAAREFASRCSVSALRTWYFVADIFAPITRRLTERNAFAIFGTGAFMWLLIEGTILRREFGTLFSSDPSHLLLSGGVLIATLIITWTAGRYTLVSRLPFKATASRAMIAVFITAVVGNGSPPSTAVQLIPMVLVWLYLLGGLEAHITEESADTIN